MTIEELLGRAGDTIGIRRVFGEPIERDGTVVVPVAVVMGGAGGGSGDNPAGQGQGSGGGFGVWARAIGAYELRDGRLRFVPALDLVSLGMVGLVLVRTVFRVARRRRK
ncbi:MAG TPA: hypothetical protein VFP72_00790 [Kineosporiaceae bacterium]|nr:hypothetical protein [Kineosporiaceae bacterium]